MNIQKQILKESQKNKKVYLVYSNKEIPCDGNNIVEATKSWYNEITKYDFNKPGFSMETVYQNQKFLHYLKQVFYHNLK